MWGQELKNKLNLLFLVLFFVVLGVWAGFYWIISYYVARNTEIQLQAMANQIVSELDNEFGMAEKISYYLGHHSLVKDFVLEKDTRKYYEQTEDVQKLLLESNYNPDFMENILLYNQSGDYFRLSGDLSNAYCKRIFQRTEKMTLPSHILVSMDQGKFMGYVTGIYDDTQKIRYGTLVMLVDEDKIMDRLYTYDQRGYIDISVVVEGENIIDTEQGKIGGSKEEDTGTYLVRRQVGLTPFEVVAKTDQSYVKVYTIYFSTAALLTVLAFGGVLFYFARMIQRRFFMPMMVTMANIEGLEVEDTESHLPMIESVEFDVLILKINEMLSRLSEKNKYIQQTQILLKNAEIEKQKAVIFSLKKQINAHFTINCLSTIQVMVSENNLEEAGEIATGLSRLIQYAYHKEEMINVWSEFEILASYVRIMNIRYENKLFVSFDIDDRLMDCEMPRMLLQPIVENAIFHGFKDKTQDCCIDIIGVRNKGNIEIKVTDNGCGMTEERLAQVRQALDRDPEIQGVENIALRNIRRRLNTYYDDKYSMDIHSEREVGTTVVLILRDDLDISIEGGF